MLKNYLTYFLIFATVTTVFLTYADELLVEPQCSNIERHEIENHLSTKTPYRVVANKEDAPIHYPGCKPTRIWSVIRHGARNPSKKIIKQAQIELMALKSKILNAPQTNLCSQELARLQFWYFNVTVEEEKFLVAEGEDELIELAERLQNRFSEILPDMYDPQAYYFKYTATQRTLESAKSFTTGLFGRNRIREVIFPEALQKDPVLRIGLNNFRPIVKTKLSSEIQDC